MKIFLFFLEAIKIVVLAQKTESVDLAEKQVFLGLIYFRY